MPETDHRPALLTDIGVAFALLTRVPCPRLPDSAFDNQARAAWAFALVGAVVGLLAAGVGWTALWTGLPGAAAAGLVLLAQVVMTGAMHEDGLADAADGLWGGWDRARRLEIMKDSAIGTYGVLALILSLGLRWVALSALLQGGIAPVIAPVIAAAALSRGLMAPVMTALPPARENGLSSGVGRPGWKVSGLAVVLAAVIALALLGGGALIPIGLAVIAVGLLALTARARIGGQTGDILGASQQVAEIAFLLGLLMLM